MPVGFAAGVLAVVAQKDDAPGAEVLRQGHGPGAGVAALAKDHGFCTRHVLGAGEAFAPEAGGHLGSVFVPPRPVHGVERVGPGAELKGGVGYNNGSPAALAAPRPGFFAVVRGEAGAAGDADNGVPAACGGRSSMMRTRPRVARSRATGSETVKRLNRRRAPPCSKLCSASTRGMECS